MKIWNGYGSEHSMNLVIIGKFKREQDAEKVEQNISKLSAQTLKEEDNFTDLPEGQRFSDDMLSLMSDLKIYTLGPTDLSQLISDHQLRRKKDQLTVTTNEAEISAFVKLFIEAGAKVEIFSAHHYPSDYDDAL